MPRREGQVGKCLPDPGINRLVSLEDHESHEKQRKMALTTRGKESAAVLHRRLGTANEHCKSSNSDELKPHHEDASLFCLVRGVAHTDGEETGDDVGRNGHQLGMLVGVSHVLDDGWEEEGDGVQGGVYSNRDEHVNIDFPVLERLKDVFEIELVGERRSVVF